MLIANFVRTLDGARVTVLQAGTTTKGEGGHWARHQLQGATRLQPVAATEGGGGVGAANQPKGAPRLARRA